MKIILGKVMWIGRGTVFLVGLAVMLAAVMGVSSMAFAAKGKPFILGKSNVAKGITTLVKQGPGPALRLLVQSGQPPMAVNSDVKVENLNADKVDGESADEIGVNGIERVSASSRFDSESPKTADVVCPAGKVAVGTGGGINGAISGDTSPNLESDVVIRYITPNNSSVTVSAMEEEPTTANWSVIATAICATAP